MCSSHSRRSVRAGLTAFRVELLLDRTVDRILEVGACGYKDLRFAGTLQITRAPRVHRAWNQARCEFSPLWSSATNGRRERGEDRTGGEGAIGNQGSVEHKYPADRKAREIAPVKYSTVRRLFHSDVRRARLSR